MRDLKLGNYGTYTNDLLIDPKTLDLMWVTGSEYIAQKLLIRLQWFSREWYLDTRYGVDWFGEVLIARPNISLIDARIKAVIRRTPGVSAITQYDSEFDRSARQYTVTFAVRANTGAVIGPLTVSIP